MAFQLEKFFLDVFAPLDGDVVTIMYDLPHDEIQDSPAWQERREMARDWHEKIKAFAPNLGVSVNPIVVYEATGAHARDLPEFGQREGVSVRIEVVFSTGHTRYFDKSDRKPVREDNGRLHSGKNAFRLRNFPCGEVFVVPNESPESKSSGEIPVRYGEETAVFVVERNHIVDVRGDGLMATQKRQEFKEEKALCNIAEVAIGCNDKAVVTGNLREDEKAGFHWAYGRSEFLGGIVGPKDFSSPRKVLHQDIVYAKGNPIVCERFDFIFPAGTRKTAIKDSKLIIEDQV